MTLPEVDHHLIRTVFNDPPLNEADLIRLLWHARHLDIRDVELANSIVSDAGNYLDSNLITALVRADITDEDVRSEIRTQKAFLSRLSLLLPAVLEHFEFNPKATAVNALSCIDDCHHDFNFASTAKRQDAIRREIFDSFRTAIRSVEKSVEALKAVEKYVDREFETIHEVYSKRVQNANKSRYYFSTLLNDLGICRDSLEIVAYRARSDEDYLIVSDNQARTTVVEYAYMMCRFWDGPALVTTPGSKFSTLCSLLYEIASGTPDESLAGAINRYARSKGPQGVRC
jgi:hypothetical protein